MPHTPPNEQTKTALRERTSSAQPPSLHQDFATELPELTRPAQLRTMTNPRVVVINHEIARDLGLDPEWLATPAGIDFMLGRSEANPQPVAQAYSGHQFGHYSPLLGDGRAALLGEIDTVDGERVDLHLKGSGLTAFSRPGSDGMAALGPMLREYLISEALAGLGIPTTRALAVISTNDVVRRERPFQAAVLVRTAASHVRVGNFQLARHLKDPEILRRLIGFTIRRHYPQLVGTRRPAAELLAATVRAQAELVAQWMTAGFIHGVMNTDNMTISGESIDFGPCAFLGTFEPGTVFSSIDAQGRYAYGNQPVIAEWNLARFAEAILPEIQRELEDAPGAEETTEASPDQAAQDEAVARATETVTSFRDHYSQAWSAGMQAKLGLSHLPATEAAALVNALPELATTHQLDHHSWYVGTLDELAELSEQPGRTEQVDARLAELDLPEDLTDWVRDWLAQAPSSSEIRQHTPRYPVRNHQIEAVLDAAVAGDVAPALRLAEILRSPFTAHADDAVARVPEPEGFGYYRTFCGT